jgi:hypothetical protein
MFRCKLGDVEVPRYLNFTIVVYMKIVSGYGLDDREIEVRSPVEVNDFSSNVVSRPALGPCSHHPQYSLCSFVKIAGTYNYH